MWGNNQVPSGRIIKFFRLVLDQNKLKVMYETNFAMVQHHKYSLTEIENMMPWEREIYVSMLTSYLKEQNDKIREQNQRRRK
jgi:hypothetical protein